MSWYDNYSKNQELPVLENKPYILQLKTKTMSYSLFVVGKWIPITPSLHNAYHFDTYKTCKNTMLLKCQQISKHVLSNTVYSDQGYCACNYKIQVLHIDTNRRNGGKKNTSTRKLRTNAGEWWRREKMQWSNKCCARNGYHKCHEVISNAKIVEWQK